MALLCRARQVLLSRPNFVCRVRGNPVVTSHRLLRHGFRVLAERTRAADRAADVVSNLTNGRARNPSCHPEEVFFHGT